MRYIIQFFVLVLCLGDVAMSANSLFQSEPIHDVSATTVLYKIVSVEGWATSLSGDRVAVSKFDEGFIHLSTAEQLERICEKYWATVAEYVLLTVDSNKFIGDLRCETNPGGANKYYHLYDGYIPLDAVIEVQCISKT